MSSAVRTPWNRRNLVVVLALNVAGLVGIIGGWVWASGRPLFENQFAAANLTVVGLIVACIGNVAWLVSGWRAVGQSKLALFGPRVEGP